MTQYDPVFYSRMLTELTLAFHIIFATIGVGVPVMIALAEWRGIRTGDPHYTLLARRWTRGFVITVAVGVVTGTAIGLQLSLLWPSFMRIAGQAIALPLFLETFAFFVEAIFLGIYLYTWDRFKKKTTHLLLMIPIVIGSSASAFFITTLNAFMNTPRGFTLEDGVIKNLQPLAAMFNPATPTKVSHVLASSYTTSAYILAAIAAYKLLKGSDHAYYKKALKLTVTAAFVFSLATAAIGDLSGKFLAKYQPEKLAAAEWHFETEREAPLVLGGVLGQNNEIKYRISIPYGLSILAHGTPDGEVIGLNEFPEDERPPLYIHYLFNLKVAFGMYLALVGFLYLLRSRKHRGRELVPKWLLAAIVAAGPLAMITIELGWFFAEVGRQPWILRGYMKVADAATTSSHVDTMLLLFCLLYLVLGVTVVRVLSKLFRNYDVIQEMISLGIEKGGRRS
ncbi:cytochrome D ubiquinol oxidase subunit 1 [Paenibacillus mucilaginosus 3016]|uniref:Cytochrome D ubiquinol oxidase subunit 1 n=1 Tax=Paenibacillus mucilaginosus 3016 TaxID=1116391 RepID=H6NT95_9BACL|nr:cytochrome ubiquinol oxidase subunit I [Paenibacillus mucilaginosus]AFC27557.1 cytochrome D ubiquinol oxidase subunit 1 [Paenibacillus mucilaginosus 3016]WFA16453.1 cytochrome ubiquinol oxidase subunit I [Paenibacillus mucilaginosus]